MPSVNEMIIVNLNQKPRNNRIPKKVSKKNAFFLKAKKIK